MQNFEHPHLLETNLFEQVKKTAIVRHRPGVGHTPDDHAVVLKYSYVCCLLRAYSQRHDWNTIYIVI